MSYQVLPEQLQAYKKIGFRNENYVLVWYSWKFHDTLQVCFDNYPKVGTEISFRLPMASSSAFEKMFREIEGCMKKPVSNMELSGNGDKDSLGIESYGISVTTLEEVAKNIK